MKQLPVYCVVTETTKEQHAGQKARRDIQTLADRLGMKRLVFTGAQTAGGGLLSKAEVILAGAYNWLKLLLLVKRDALVLFQYPHRPVKSARLGKIALPLIRKLKHIRFAALVHDLDSLRHLHGEGAIYSDYAFLPLFDHIICHNEKMKGHLMKQGVAAEKLTVLEVFDYLIAPLPEREKELPFSLCIAGNLSPEQSGYLYLLIEDPARNYPLHLYGPGFAGETDEEKRVYYHGVLPADELPFHLEGKYGLVWGGESMEGCTGDFGEYIRYNNPHKLSLYLASGMPVILWNEAAMAEFVLKNGVGIGVSCLNELQENVPLSDAAALERVQKNIASGYYFTNAMEKIGYIKEETSHGKE